MLEVRDTANIIVDQMAPHTISLTSQQPVEKYVESSARACPPGTLEKNGVACLIRLPEQLQMLEPSILPPSRLDLQDCYIIHSNETVPVDADGFPSVWALCGEIVNTLLSPFVDGNVPLLSTLYNIRPGNLLDVNGCELEGYCASISLLITCAHQKSNAWVKLMIDNQ